MNFRRLFSLFQLAILVLMANTYCARAQCKPLVTNEYNLVEDFNNTLFNPYKSGKVPVTKIKNTYFSKSTACMNNSEIDKLIEALKGAFSSIMKEDPTVIAYINKLEQLKKESEQKGAGNTGTYDPDSIRQRSKELVAKLDKLEKNIIQRLERTEQKLDIVLGLLILLGGTSIALSLKNRTKNLTGRTSQKQSGQIKDNKDDQTPVADPEPTDDAPKRSNTLKAPSSSSVPEIKTSDKTTSKANQIRTSQKQTPEAESVSQISEIQEPIELGTTIFYLSVPTSRDGRTTFNDTRSSEFDSTSTFYKFNLIQGEADKAYFWYVDDPDTVKSALDYPSRYLKPACKYDPNLNYNAKQIVTDQPGIAILEGSIWRMERKAKIRIV